MWTLLFTKEFFRQLLNLPTDKRKFVLDSMDFLAGTVDVNRRFDIDVIDEYDEEASKPAQPFPITYYIDYKQEKLYFIRIEESYRSSTTKT